MKPEFCRDEGYQFMGAAFEVYNVRGYGIPFRSKPELLCSYKGQQLRKSYYPDLLIFEMMVVELKAVTTLSSEHEAQLLNYMRISRRPIGYLVNFGHKDTLEWKRFILSEFIPPSAKMSAD